jgi:predicted NBD/HSP70 family sugar kinase
VRKLLAVAVFILFLSLSTAFAGHVVVGNGYASCECGTPGCIEDYPGECGGYQAMNQQSTPSNLGSGTLLIIAALLLGLKLRA